MSKKYSSRTNIRRNGSSSKMKRIPKRRTLSNPIQRTFGIPPKRDDIPRVFKPSLIGGSKPKGWEKRPSKYRISFKAEYKVKASEHSFTVPGKRHYITISNATLRGTKGKDLEKESLIRINRNVDIWKQKEIASLESNYPPEAGYSVFYNRSGSSWRIYRVG